MMVGERRLCGVPRPSLLREPSETQRGGSMRRTIGVNTWVWVSPVTDASLPELAAKAAALGFGAIELPVEQPGDWSPDAAAETLAQHGLAPIVVGAMGPGRNLVAARGSEIVATQNYLVHCVKVAERLG